MRSLLANVYVFVYITGGKLMSDLFGEEYIQSQIRETEQGYTMEGRAYR